MTQPHDPPQTPPPFQLYRDTHGIPHVRAATERALAHGQGYVTALDRAHQIEAGRLRAEARLAARTGPDGLAWDRFAVRVRLADTARRVADALAAPEREWLAAYARGVNAGLAARAGEAAGPGPWRPWTPIGLFLVDHVLFNGFPGVLWRDHVARTLGPRFPGVPPRTRAEWFAADGGPGAGGASGSNAWAVAPDATASGSPLLAGDPHRTLELPGTYQQIRLACTAEGADGDEVPYDVLGLAFPGVPGVQHFGYALSDGGAAGGTTGVAWGITNAMAHHVEVFEERLRRSADGGWEAEGPDGWEPAAGGFETIEIRDLDGEAAGSPHPRRESVPWIETTRGVRVATRHDDRDDGRDGPDTRHFTIRWPVRVLADAGVPTWRRLLRARSARDVATAFRDGWVDPVNRVLTADTGGEILGLTAGRVAERAPDERVLPVPAWTDAARPRAWTRLPEPERVTSGVAVDANERPTTQRPAGNAPHDHRRDREAHALGWSYAPHRADRIRELLATPPAGGESPGTQHRVHADVSSRAALALMARLGVPERLRSWAEAGAPMHADSADAAAFARWRDALVRHVARDPRLDGLRTGGSPYGEIYAPWFDPDAAVGFGLLRLLDALGIDPGDPDLPQPDTPPAPHAPPPATTWGDLHTLAPARLPGGPDLPVPAAPVSGDNDTVRCTGGTPGGSPRAARGSVARWIWDLSDRRASRWVVPFGASGVPGDPHTTDQHATWAAGGTVPVETDWDRLTPVHPAMSTPSPEPPRRLLHGPRGAEVWRTTTPRGVITAHVLDPDADLDVLHAWVTAPRARFWGLAGLTRDELRETYEFVDSLPTHNAYLVRWDGTPVALVQAYHPEDDPVAAAYPVADGDLGLHFFRAPTLPEHAGGGAESWAVLGSALARFLFAAPGTRRLIAEPDASNAAALARMTTFGFEAGERVRFESPNGPKDAVMAYLTRERAELLDQ